LPDREGGETGDERRRIHGAVFLARAGEAVPDGALLWTSKRAVLDVVYVLTETVRRTARKITWRGLYQRLVKTDPLKCILCGSQMCFSGLKRGLRLPDLLACHEQLAQMKICG